VAPFDGIVVTASTPALPEPLVEQLAEGGRLVIPVGPLEEQQLMLYKKDKGQMSSQTLGNCRFVKLIGEYAWP